ncbi:hypothetical protein BJ322DRAFT_1004377 [Thelephora terrestris]|uniref:YCII-related domain-containing protein n=1 Tax=Thelephora terrestris TaxID=56493 RepID=A0A9P6L7K9_9AGAM|nr:hypothetical protein BJ322DRAFT_1004377 [Thelephora terrestris]
MSTSEQLQKHHFMVYAPDSTEPGTLQRRLALRPEHLERINTLRTSGVLKVIGPTLTPESVLPGAEQKLNGSLLIAEASSIEEVKKIVEGDVFYTENVWDKEKMIITPMILAHPK